MTDARSAIYHKRHPTEPGMWTVVDPKFPGYFPLYSQEMTAIIHVAAS